MKLQSLGVIFLLGVAGLAEMINGMCLLRNTDEPKIYWYHCFMVNNYLADVRSAPIDIPKITFSNSKIPVLGNRSFSRLGKSLEFLEIDFCETREIDNKAFEGLVKLHELNITENNLEVVKGVWFKGLPNLKTISLRGNRIKQIEESFYSTVPPLEILDITVNELSCFPMPPAKLFKTKMLHFLHNPLSWGCISSLISWLNQTGIEHDDFGLQGNWDPSPEIVLECEKRLGKPHDQLSQDDLEKCSDKMATEFLPTQENYTVNQVCQFLKNKPSPFLTCY